MSTDHEPPLLSLRVERDADVGRVEVEGELDIASTPELRQALTSLLDEDVDVELDLSRLRFMDSAGLGVLVGALARLADGQRLVVTQASRPVTRLFEVTGLAASLGLPTNPA